MKTLTVELKVPIETEPFVGTPTLAFSHWLPIGKANGIHIAEDRMDLQLYFDLQTSWQTSRPSEENLKKQANVLAKYVRAEITIREVTTELATYMQTRDCTKLPTESTKTMQNEFEKLGERILRVLFKRINRLIAYARALKGQFWLLQYGSDNGCLRSYFQTFEAMGRINDGELFRFQPGVNVMITIPITPTDRFIKESEWTDVIQFVKGQHRTPLVLELLAGAEQLAKQGHPRSALTEAVTALEVAVLAFGRSQDKKGRLAAVLGPRIAVERVQKQIEHMGLSGTVNYLLPLLLPEAVLNAEILSGCQKAVAERQNVVHNGQRDITDIYKLISSIKACCKILSQYCNDEHSSSAL